jgi:hypothetical protein
MIKAVSAVGLVVWLAGTPALSSPLLDLVAQQAAKRALAPAAAGAPAEPASSALEQARRIAGAPQSASAPAATVAAPSGAWPEPAPINYPSAQVKRAGEFKFSAETLAKVKAFEGFAAVRCSDCEGGMTYDSSIRLIRPPWLGDRPVQAVIAGLKVGQAYTWKGEASVGALTVLSEQPIGPFPCRQVRYTLTRGKQTAERPGLFCFTKGEYTDPAWTEIL